VLPIPQPSVPLNFGTGDHNATYRQKQREHGGGPSRNPAKFARNRRRSGGGVAGARAGGPLPCRSKPGPPWPPPAYSLARKETRRGHRHEGAGGDRGPGQLTPTRRSGDRGAEFRTGGEVTLPSGFLPLPSPSSSSLSPRFSIDDECFFFFFSLLPFFAWLASRVRWWLVFSLSYSAARRTYRPLSNPVFSGRTSPPPTKPPGDGGGLVASRL
jgi:hypothetical protein